MANIPARLSAPSASGGALQDSSDVFRELVERLDRQGGVRLSVRVKPTLPEGPLKDLLERLDNQSVERAVKVKGRVPTRARGLVFAVAGFVMGEVLRRYINENEPQGLPESKAEEEEEIAFDAVRAALLALERARKEIDGKRHKRNSKKRRVRVYVWSRVAAR